MQPQDQPTPPNPSPLQTPSWFDSSPQPLQPAPKKKPILLIVALIILLLGAGGAAAYFWWQSSQSKQEATPKQAVALTEQEASELYLAAVENHMNTPYITQKAEQTIGSGSTKVTMKLDATSDFSDPTLSKTKLVYTAKGEKTPEESTGTEFEQVALGSELYVKTPEAEAPEPSSLYKSDQWYHIAADNELGKLLLDPLSVAKGINTPLGQVPVGKFSDDIRKELMTFIRDNEVYRLTSHKAETLNGQEVQRFTIKLNVEKSDELNEKAAQLLGIENVLADRPEGTPTIEQFDAWIGRADEKFKKVHFSISDDGKELGSSTFTFEYPTKSPDITKPTGAIEAPRQ